MNSEIISKLGFPSTLRAQYSVYQTGWKIFTPDGLSSVGWWSMGGQHHQDRHMHGVLRLGPITSAEVKTEDEIACLTMSAGFPRSVSRLSRFVGVFFFLFPFPLPRELLRCCFSFSISPLLLPVGLGVSFSFLSVVVGVFLFIRAPVGSWCCRLGFHSICPYSVGVVSRGVVGGVPLPAFWPNDDTTFCSANATICLS